jgi:hypothetical protein
MKVTGLVTLVLSAAVAISCGDVSVNTGPETRSSNMTMPLPDSMVGSDGLPPLTFGNENIVTPVASINGPVLNPRHGEPGHRCDIAVGQPLNNRPVTHLIAANSSILTAAPAATNGVTLHPAPIINPNFRTVANSTAYSSSITSNAALNPAHGQPGHRCDIPVGSPMNSIPTTTNISPTISSTINSAAVAPGMNPAHGQPGHRCDIPVGKPLNSTPSTTNTLPTSAAATNNTPVAPGMNPAHGQPGHRCDIAVGKPLNSLPPATTTSTKTSTPNSSAVANGLNPAHGQPGHRCDIPVGKPLNSATSTANTATASSSTDSASTTSSSTTPPATNSPIIATTTDSSAGAVALNPKHGQPGHRCDIPVGKPLNSTPSTTNTSSTSNSSTQASSKASPAANLAAAALGLNPAHGKPGHRCDIPVGNPLTSKPVKK